MCGKGVHSWTQGSSSTRAVKVEQISPLFHLYLYLFFKSEEHPFFANLACQGGEVDLSDSVVAFKFIYFKHIYTRERLLLAKSAKQAKGKGVSRSQLQCQATTALRKNSVLLNRARVIEINVCEVREGNFDDKVRVTWI